MAQSISLLLLGFAHFFTVASAQTHANWSPVSPQLWTDFALSPGPMTPTVEAQAYCSAAAAGFQGNPNYSWPPRVVFVSPGDPAYPDSATIIGNWEGALIRCAMTYIPWGTIAYAGYGFLGGRCPEPREQYRPLDFKAGWQLYSIAINLPLQPSFVNGPSAWCAKFPACQQFPYPGQTNSTPALPQCGGATVDLNAGIGRTGPETALFHEIQACIARKSCNQTCRNDNCKWLKKVVPDFVRPYVQKSGEWQAIERNCQLLSALGPVGSLICAERMAAYHIEVDLRSALASSGCGTESDWSNVYSHIQSCTNTSLPMLGPMAAYSISRKRNITREQCVADRSTLGAPVTINTELSGQSCF